MRKQPKNEAGDRQAGGKPAKPSPSQHDKFIQAAREAECDETGEVLDEALRAIGRAGKK